MTTYSAEFKLEKSGKNPKPQKKLEKSMNESNNFNLVTYSQVIYDELTPLKPTLTKIKTGEKVGWEEYFENKAFNELNEIQRKTLFMLVEYEYPYRLPEKYYDDRDRIQERLNGTY